MIIHSREIYQPPSGSHVRWHDVAPLTGREVVIGITVVGAATAPQPVTGNNWSLSRIPSGYVKIAIENGNL